MTISDVNWLLTRKSWKVVDKIRYIIIYFEDLVHAYKSLLAEKDALQSTVQALSQSTEEDDHQITTIDSGTSVMDSMKKVDSQSDIESVSDYGTKVSIYIWSNGDVSIC